MKRSRYKVMGPKNFALKNMRNARGVSIRKLAKLMGVKENRVNHYENGRVEVIPQDYIDEFLKALEFSDEDWQDFMNGRVTAYDLEQRCVDLIKGLDKNKLQSIYSLIESFSK